MVKETMTRGLFMLALTALTLLAAPQPTAAQVTDEHAPPTFRARFETSQGPFVIEVQREWAPIAADRGSACLTSSAESRYRSV